MVVFGIINSHFLAMACYLIKKASVRELHNGPSQFAESPNAKPWH